MPKLEKDASDLLEVITRIYEKHDTEIRISPSWLATVAMQHLDPKRVAPLLVHKGCHLQLRQLARRQRDYQRDYRERETLGISCFLGYAPPALVEALIDAGLLAAEEASNKKTLGAAVVEVASLWAQNRGGKNNC